MAVLNSTIMRRTRGLSINAKNIKSKHTNDLAFNKKPIQVPVKSDIVEHTQVRGTFSSQRKVAISQMDSQNKELRNLLRSNPGRRMSSIKVRDLPTFKEEEKKKMNLARSFWDVAGTHHTLPVFAAGRSYVPSIFDSLLCQSFFASLSPVLCEKIVCGQTNQTIYQEALPSNFVGQIFLNVFRAFQSRNVLVLGLYRSAMTTTEAVLPYVYTSPWPEAVLRSHDRLFLFGHPAIIRAALNEFRTPFSRDGKGQLGLNSGIPLNKLASIRQSVLGNLQGRPSKVIMEEEKDALEALQKKIIGVNGNTPKQYGWKAYGDRLESYATVIQAMYRGYALRRRLKKFNKS